MVPSKPWKPNFPEKEWESKCRPGKAFFTLSKLPTSATAELQKETFSNVFGLTPESAFAKLVTLRFEIGEDDTDVFGTQIADLVKTAFPSGIIRKDLLSQKFIWNSLPHSQEMINLRTLRQVGNGADSVDVLDICRESFLNDFPENEFVHSFYPRNDGRAIDKHNRGKGKGKGKC